MKLKNIFIVLSLVLVPLFLTGCTLLQNVGNLTPSVLIKDLSQEEVEGFLLEVVANMEADTSYKVSIDSGGYLIKFLIDGENSFMDGESTEGQVKNYTIDGATYFYSDGRWLKFSATDTSDDDTSLFDDELFREEIKNITYLRKEACPDGNGTCYVFELNEDGSIGTIFINATRKLPVKFEENENGSLTTVTYDFDTTERVVLPQEAENATTL